MNRIKDLRKIKKLSQDELAKAVHVHQTSVSQWETGKTFPDTAQAIALAKYFNVTTDYLLGISDAPTPSDKKKEAPPTLEEVEGAYIKMLAEKKGVRVEDLVLDDDDKNALRGAILAMIKGFGK